MAYKNQDPNLICKVVAGNEETCQDWTHDLNAARYQGPDLQGSIFEDQEPTIHLRLDKRPRDPRQGFIFGPNEESCDVFCGGPQSSGNSNNQLFRIFIEESGAVILEHLAPHTSMTVQYNNQSPIERSIFSWNLVEDAAIIVTVDDRLVFKVIVPSHDSDIGTYQRQCRDFLAKGGTLTRFAALGMQTCQTAPIRGLPTVRQEPAYYHVPKSLLGHGNFGKVFIVLDVSTRKKYAAKNLRGSRAWRKAKALTHLGHVSSISRGESYELIKLAGQSCSIPRSIS